MFQPRASSFSYIFFYTRYIFLILSPVDSRVINRVISDCNYLQVRRWERTIHFTTFLNIVKLWFYLTAAWLEASLYHWKSPSSWAITLKPLSYALSTMIYIRAVKFTLLYLLCLILLLILFTNSPKPGKLTFLPVEIKTKIY